ncbi:MAG: InlB B-repeat-containing protein [Anaerobutyricum sp.]
MFTSADTTNGTKVGQWTANNSNAQKWKLESVSQKDYPDRKQFGDHNLVINSVEPVYTNHTFIGWNTSRDGTGKFYYPGDTYSAINTGTNVTLYAVWQIDDYIITYDSNGGTGTMAAQSAKGETAVKLTKNVFQRAGYLFTGWATDRYAMKPSYLDEAQYPNMEPEVTLYAQWQKTGTGFIQRPFLDDKMFYKAISILGQNGTTYDREKIDSSMAHIDTADNPGYFSKK